MIKAFIAAQPKSASTHLAFSLARYFDGAYGAVNYYANNGIEAQDIFPPMLDAAIADPKPLVVKPHVQATPNNVMALSRAGIKPIVTTRNIFDTILSMKEHFDHITLDPEHPEYMKGDFVPMPIGIPFYQDTYKALSPTHRMDYIIDIFAPWILHFQHGWERVRGEIFRCDYDDLMKNKADVVKHIIRFLGEEPDEEALAVDFNHQDLRYNKATSGRGWKELSTVQKQRIDEMAWRIRVTPEDAVSRR